MGATMTMLKCEVSNAECGDGTSTPHSALRTPHSTFRTPHSTFHIPRRFGWTVGGALLAIAMVFWVVAPERHRLLCDLLASAGTALVILGTVYPAALREVCAGWFMLAHALGWFNTRVLLTLFYYAVVSPIGLVMRFFGRDPLDRKWSQHQQSYWVEREEQREPDHFEHQF